MTGQIVQKSVATGGAAEPVVRPHRATTWPGLGLKTREILAITLFTFLVVAMTTLFHLSHVVRVTLEDTFREGEVLARQLYGLSAGALARAADRDPAWTLRNDAQLRTFVEFAVQYSPHVLYVAVEDQAG